MPAWNLLKGPSAFAEEQDRQVGSVGVRGHAGNSRRRSGQIAIALTAGVACGAGVQSCSSDVVVVRVGSVEVVPGSVTLAPGESILLTVDVRDDDGQPLPAPDVDWVSVDPSVVSVTPGGFIEARGRGATEVHATVGQATGIAEVHVEATAVLEVTPEGVAYFIPLGGAPEAAAIDITNGGSGQLLDLSATVEYGDGGRDGWLNPSLSSTSAPATLALSGLTGSLPVGTYHATVVLESVTASNSPVHIPVTLSVTQGAIIRLVPSAVGFAAVLGGGAPGPRTVRVENAGGEVLDHLGAQVSYDDVGGWLSATLQGAAAPTDLTLTADPGSLPAGSYRAEVAVTSPGVVNSPKTLVVTLVVEPEPEADLQVVKEGPSEAVEGDTLVFVLSVTNLGPRAASDVRYLDSLPEGLEYRSSSSGGSFSDGVVTWSAGTVESGAVVTDTVRAVAPVGSWTNVARVSTSTLDPVAGNDRAEATVDVRPRPAGLEVEKSGPANAVVGETLRYVITTTNVGPGPAGDVVVTDSLPAGLAVTSTSAGGAVENGVVTWSAGPLAVGSSRVDTVIARVDVEGSLRNVARVSTSSADQSTSDDRAEVSTVVGRLADLSLEKTGDAEASVGDTLVYALSVTNSGPSSVPSVQLVDSLPEGVILISATGAPQVSGRVLTWEKGALDVDAETVDSVRVTAEVVGEVTNVARIVSPTADPDMADRRSSVATTIAGADLSVTKTGPSQVQLGDTITYLVTWSNDGPGRARDVVVTDSLPDDVVFLSASGGGVHAGNTVVWTRAQLEAEVSSTDTVHVRALLSGERTNVVRIASPTDDPDSDDVRSSVTTQVTGPLLGADLSITKSGPATASVGDTLTYRISLTNAGPNAALTVVVRDSVPAGTQVVSASSGGAVSGRTVTWNRLVFGAGAHVVDTIRVIANSEGSLVNVVRVSSLTGDQDSQDRRDTATTVVGADDP